MKLDDLQVGDIVTYANGRKNYVNHPDRYYKNYTCDKDKKIESFIEYKYETIDFYSYLKDMKKQTIPTSENEKGQTIISRFRRKKIKALCIQDERTNRQKFFSFDLEENPINCREDVLEN